MAPRIEPARAADAGRIGHMSRRLIEQGLDWRWTPRSVLRQIHDPDTAVVVARPLRGGAGIEGFGVMQYHFASRTAHLVLLAVEPELQRRGLGQALLTWLEKIARLGGIQAIGLEVRVGNHAAQCFYRGLGYADAERLHGYYQRREDALRLSKQLSCRHPA